MNGDGRNGSLWRFFDGTASVSMSMLLAILLSQCAFCVGVPLLDRLIALTQRDDGIIMTATLLLFPTAMVLYGGSKMFFAAKEAVERKARERGRQEGIDQGRQEGIDQGRQEGVEAERQRIIAILERNGITLSEEIAESVERDGEQDRS